MINTETNREGANMVSKRHLEEYCMGRRITVKVLRGYKGFSQDVEIVETIVRKARKHSGKYHGRTVGPAWSDVSYKGVYYAVFHLPACYDKIAGNCICIERC